MLKTIMKRSWFPILIIAPVLALLTLFLGLQYKWLSEVSQAEQDRMQKRVETDVVRFAEDFNREMHAAYYNFQVDGDAWRTGDWSEFNARYEFWKGRTAYPELIRGIYFVGREPESQLFKYNAEKNSFEKTEPTPELESLRARVTNDATFAPFYEDACAMTLPIYQGERRVDHIVLKRRSGELGTSQVRVPETFGWLVVMLDEPTLKNRVLPDLAAKYFSEGDFKISITNREQENVFSTADGVSLVDASAPMFNMSPDNLMYFGGRDVLPKILEEHKRKGLVINQRVESHTFRRTETINGKTGTFQLKLEHPGEDAKPRTTVVAATTSDPPWKLRVQHTAGSIGAFVSGERNKSFLIGLGIYLLLVAGIVAILLSSLRARAFAKRQIDFVSSVSHEFRTPLAVIYSAGENLADGVAKEQGQVSRYGELIKGEGKKLSGMVEQILEFAGANSRRKNYNFAPIEVSEIVADALAECRPLIESGGFTVETDVSENLPAISADKLALSSAIQNLIANSVKYSDGSKWIKVSAANGNQIVKIAVEDLGRGIAGSEQKRIFEPFYRAKEVIDAQISGNGLGLNLVKKIVEAHGGKVSVESQPGKGSIFTIELPQN